MELPLWLAADESGTTISPSRCRNCGQVKAISNPCGFDHLAAVLEFKKAVAEYA